MVMKRLIENTENTYMKIETNYHIGGHNYFTGKQEARGIYVHFSNVEIEAKNGYTCEQSTPFSDSSFKMMFKPLKRKSQKQTMLVNEIICDNSDELFELYGNGEYGMLYDNLIALRGFENQEQIGA